MAKAIGRLLLFDTLLGDGNVIPHAQELYQRGAPFGYV